MARLASIVAVFVGTAIFTAVAISMLELGLSPHVNYHLRSWNIPHGPGQDDAGTTFNETLGFQKVLVIGLPERSDKRDALALMAGVTDIELTWIDGVRGSDISNKALPYGWNRETMSDSNLGSWRGHIDAIRYIVEENISSALIMEDDMDWDTHLKYQLSSFAAGARHLEEGFPKTPDDITSQSPYGQAWDMLWVGSCATTFAEDLPAHLAVEHPDSRKYIITNDETVPPPAHRLGNNGFSFDDFPAQTRIVHVPGDNICSFAYALSQSGARKALNYLALVDVHKAFDNHLSDFCRVRPFGTRCVGVVPSLFVHHRPKGRVSGDSDIGNSENQEIREKGFTENILYSTRLNLERLILGEEPEKQWDD